MSSAANHVLSCHFDGAEGSTSIVDVKGHILTASGTARITQTQSKFGSGSLLFDGSGGLVSAPDSDDWWFGSGDFTFGFWVRAASLSDTMEIISQRGSSDPNNFFLIRINTTGTIRVYCRNTAGLITDITSIGTVSVGVWSHVAVTSLSGVKKIWVGGVNNDTVTLNSSTAWPNISGDILSIGSSESSNYFKGCIDDLLVTKECLFTSDFTPPIYANADYDFISGGFSNTAVGTPTALISEHFVAGISSTQFGAPIGEPAQIGEASGIAPTTQFGLPVADFAKRFIPTGIAPAAALGAPFGIYPQFGVTTGFRRWTFGTPTRTIYNYTPSASQGARLGQPSAKTLSRTAQAGGFNSTHFGIPSRSGGITGLVSSISPGTVGAPSAKYPQYGSTAGIRPHTIFGTPRFPLDESLDTLFVFQKTKRVDVWSEL